MPKSECLNKNIEVKMLKKKLNFMIRPNRQEIKASIFYSLYNIIKFYQSYRIINKLDIG